MLNHSAPGSWVVEAMATGGVDLARLAERMPAVFEQLVAAPETVSPDDLVGLLDGCASMSGDWNCGSTSLDATRVGNAVNHLDIMLEQPCETIEQCDRVKAATGLPMKLDENAHDTASLLKGYEAGCMDAVAIKLSKFGELSACRRARDLCLHLGAKMCVEDTWGSDITTAALLHLGATTAPKFLMNVCDLSGYVSPRIAPDCPIRVNGHISPPAGPGLGISPDLDILGTPIAEFN